MYEFPVYSRFGFPYCVLRTYVVYFLGFLGLLYILHTHFLGFG